MFSGEYLIWSIVFFLLAIVSAAIEAENIGVEMRVAKWFVAVYLVLAVVALVL